MPAKAGRKDFCNSVAVHPECGLPLLFAAWLASPGRRITIPGGSAAAAKPLKRSSSLPEKQSLSANRMAQPLS